MGKTNSNLYNGISFYMSNSEGVKIIFTPSCGEEGTQKENLFEELYLITYNFAK